MNVHISVEPVITQSLPLYTEKQYGVYGHAVFFHHKATSCLRFNHCFLDDIGKKPRHVNAQVINPVNAEYFVRSSAHKIIEMRRPNNAHINIRI